METSHQGTHSALIEEENIHKRSVVMDKSYSVSNIAGYADHLPVETVRLPLKYPETKQDESLNELFTAKTACSGDIIDVKESYIDYVSYQVLNDLKTIHLNPILLQNNALNLKFKRLAIELPHSIKSSSRLTIQLNCDSEEPTLILDLIDENYLFVTIEVELADFVVNENRRSRLNLDNFKSWGHISVPYSFELRSAPFLLKSTSPTNVFVSLEDGGLLYFQRPSPLKAFDVYNFNNSSYVLPLNFMTGLFRKSGKREIVLDGISSNAVVDIIPINDEVIVTLSVTKVLKVWNLLTRNQVIAPIELTQGEDPSASSVWLTSVSRKYLQIIPDPNSHKKYLTTYFNSDSSQSDGENGTVFKLWEIMAFKTQAQLVEIENLTFKPELPQVLVSPDQEVYHESSNHYGSIWLIQDYQTQHFGDTVKYHILWKSNTSSIVVSYSLNFSTGSILSINWSHSDGVVLNEFSPQHDVDYYANKILNSGTYDQLTVTTALNIYRQHLKLDRIDNFERKSIRHAIIDTIQSSAFSDSKDSWYQLNLLCEEFKKLGQEALALTLTKHSAMIALQVNGLGIIRPSHYYETFVVQKKRTSEGRLAELLNGLTKKLSSKTYNKLYSNISHHSKVDAAKATELFSTYLMNKISDDEAQSIMQELESIPNIMDVIDFLIEPIASTIDSNGVNSSLGLLSKLNSVITMKTIKFQHETILLNLLVLFLICEVNDQVLLLINRILEKLATYSVVEFVLNTSFTSNVPSSRIETSKLNNLEFSLFWSAVVNKNKHVSGLIQSGKLNDAYDSIHASISGENYNNFIVDVVTELINHNEGPMIKQAVFDKLNKTEPIDVFLIGLIHLINNEPLQFFEVFGNYDVFKRNNKPAIKTKLMESLKSNENIKSFLTSIFIDDSSPLVLKYNYFHSLSELSKAQNSHHRRHHSHFRKMINSESGLASITSTSNHTEVEFIENALKFEKIAIATLKEESDGTDEKLINLKLEEFYLNVFESALEISNFDLIYEALLNLKPVLNKKLYKSLFAKFIASLIAQKNISVLFPSQQNELYKENFLLIDSILLDAANSELVLSKSLKCYEYLFSWRLFGASNGLQSRDIADKRGAVEALYMFITRFKFEQSNLLTLDSSEDIKQYNLKILEVYIIIINCLKSFTNDDDRWLVSQHANNKTTITTLDQIRVEYYEWLKLLDHDMNS